LLQWQRSLLPNFTALDPGGRPHLRAARL